MFPTLLTPPNTTSQRSLKIKIFVSYLGEVPLKRRRGLMVLVGAKPRPEH